jgi:hypothetical protein
MIATTFIALAVGILVVAVLTWLTWVSLMLARIAAIMARVEERLDQQEQLQPHRTRPTWPPETFAAAPPPRERA